MSADDDLRIAIDRLMSVILTIARAQCDTHAEWLEPFFASQVMLLG